MPEVTCPRCGSSMVVRTARAGRRSGRKFYGCSRYPQCKGTRPVESTPLDPSVPEQQPQEANLSSLAVFFPRRLVARERFPDHQVRFFEAAAIPQDVMKKIDLEEKGGRILRAFSQWRLDFPVRGTEPTLTQRQCQVVAVLEKILTRGRITLLSPRLEEKFKNLFLKMSDIQFPLSVLENLVLRGYRRNYKPPWLDSDEERLFHKDIVSRFLGDNYVQFVLPQIEMSSLLPLNIIGTGYERSDFGIFHPLLEERIIVEIDGEQHKRHVDADAERDRTLQESGYRVVRIQAHEIRENNGSGVSRLESELSAIGRIPDEDGLASSPEIVQYVYAVRLAHQIQIVLLQAIESGFLSLEDVGSWDIAADLDELGLFDKKVSQTVLESSVADFGDLLNRLGRLYSVQTGENPKCSLLSDNSDPRSQNRICISFSDRHGSNRPTFYVENIYFPFHIAHSSFPTTPLAAGSLEEPEQENLEYLLQYLFRKPSFWEGQYDGITRTLRGKDTLMLLPTGAGKSLVYQLASLLLPGRAVVIDPLISLMDDQIDNLAMVGIDRCISITSQITDPLDRSRAMALFGQGEYLFAYVTPERFQTTEFRDSLRTLTVHTPIALIVVDETHCVSEWGHDFRTAYLNIGRTSRTYCESTGNIPPLLGLTGTASRGVLKDVQRELQIQDFDAVITPRSFDRPELKFSVIYSTSQEKRARLKGYLGQMLPSLFGVTNSTLHQVRGEETYSGLVFCPHVGGEFGVERVSSEIRHELGISSDMYSGKAPKHWEREHYGHYKQRVAKGFKRNRVPLLVCTKAFGMGIDKPNIRYTVHFNIPPSIESFYQEAGRAGRDRKPAHCCVIVSIDDADRSKKLLDPKTRIEDMTEILSNTPWEEGDDITRDLYFHTKAFRGIAREEQDIDDILGNLGDLSRKRELALPVPEKITARTADRGQARQTAEKALHRLLLIGIVSDYVIDYNSDEFTVKLSGIDKEAIVRTYGEYVTSYSYDRGQKEFKEASKLAHLPMMEFVRAILDLLLRFIYDAIERGRRRALSEMVQACTASRTDKGIRERILRYLEATEYSEDLEEVISSKNAGMEKCKGLVNSVRSPNEAAELRGQVSRYLESYPDHPGLLMLRALSEVLSRDKDIEIVRENIAASLSSALSTYGLNESSVLEFAAWAASIVNRQNREWARALVLHLLQSHPSRYLARKLIEQLPLALTGAAAWFLLTKIQENCESLVTREES